MSQRNIPLELFQVQGSDGPWFAGHLLRRLAAKAPRIVANGFDLVPHYDTNEIEILDVIEGEETLALSEFIRWLHEIVSAVDVDGFRPWDIINRGPLHTD